MFSSFKKTVSNHRLSNPRLFLNFKSIKEIYCDVRKTCDKGKSVMLFCEINLNYKIVLLCHCSFFFLRQAL